MPRVFLRITCCLAASPDCLLTCFYPVLRALEQKPLVATLKGSGSGQSMLIRWCKPGWREKKRPARSSMRRSCEVLLCSLEIKCCCDRLGGKGRTSWQTDGRRRYMWSLHNPMPRFLCYGVLGIYWKVGAWIKGFPIRMVGAFPKAFSVPREIKKFFNTVCLDVIFVETGVFSQWHCPMGAMRTPVTHPFHVRWCEVAGWSAWCWQSHTDLKNCKSQFRGLLWNWRFPSFRPVNCVVGVMVSFEMEAMSCSIFCPVMLLLVWVPKLAGQTTGVSVYLHLRKQ